MATHSDGHLGVRSRQAPIGVYVVSSFNGSLILCARQSRLCVLSCATAFIQRFVAKRWEAPHLHGITAHLGHESKVAPTMSIKTSDTVVGKADPPVSPKPASAMSTSLVTLASAILVLLAALGTASFVAGTQGEANVGSKNAWDSLTSKLQIHSCECLPGKCYSTEFRTIRTCPRHS